MQLHGNQNFPDQDVFPFFLGKPTASWNSRSQISPRMLFEGPDQRNSDMVSRIKMSPLAKGQGSCDRDRTESSTSRSKGYSSSNNDGDSFLGRWPFARPEGEMRRQRTSCFLSSSAPCT